MLRAPSHQRGKLLLFVFVFIFFSSVLAEETLERGDETKDSISKRILEHQERAFATENNRGDNFSGFVQSLLVMLSLEFGDRTFFIASLMSGKYDSKEVFFGAILALW